MNPLRLDDSYLPATEDGGPKMPTWRVQSRASNLMGELLVQDGRSGRDERAQPSDKRTSGSCCASPKQLSKEKDWNGALAS